MNPSMRKRRKLITALGAGALAAPRLAPAQQPALPRIGFILSNDLATNALKPFKQGMGEDDLIEGKHYFIDAIYADGHYERFPALAKELVQRAPTVIVVNTTPAVRAAQLATRTVPIVMAGVNDPVGSDVILSLARPGPARRQHYRAVEPGRRRIGQICRICA